MQIRTLVTALSLGGMLLVGCHSSLAAEATDGVADNATAIINPRFRTLKVMKEGDLMSPPVIRLGSGERISVSFDELADDYTELQYRLIHCNSDWTPSRLMESEYLDGFNEADIEDYAFSQNTFVHYVNYRFTIPSGRMNPLVAGNYLVEVYPRLEPEDVILRARIQVESGSARIGGMASGRTDRGINTEWQQLAMKIVTDPQEVQNPYSDLIVTVTQNCRPETMRVLRRPMRVNGGELVYESLPELIFPAGNEYRRFETVRTDYPGLGIDSVSFSDGVYRAYPNLGETRADRSYVYDSTQHGRFVIDEYNSTDPDLGADYVAVDFRLDFPMIMDGDVYVDGEFTGHNFTEANRMTYNPHTGLHEATIPLKQGSYNYQYVIKRRGGDGKIDPAPVEGNYAETRNEYNVSVYLRRPGSRGDILIGAQTLRTQQ